MSHDDILATVAASAVNDPHLCGRELPFDQSFGDLVELGLG
ncbi:hypothetical protein NG819_15455 [Pseudarthrobacter sp. Fe7]|nr:hypothetical protein NG819_15455 [Pseudarthrobacter sp. Fe7]